jgi:hypothetical protein
MIRADVVPVGALLEGYGLGHLGAGSGILGCASVRIESAKLRRDSGSEPGEPGERVRGLILGELIQVTDLYDQARPFRGGRRESEHVPAIASRRDCCTSTSRIRR